MTTTAPPAHKTKAMVNTLREAFAGAIDRVYPDRDAPAHIMSLMHTVNDAAYAPTRPRTGTMRDWMEAHHGQAVHTVQANSNNLASVWIPGVRYIDTESAKGSVYLGDGSREYAGCWVEHMTDDVLIVSLSMYDDVRQIVAYVVEGDR